MKIIKHFPESAEEYLMDANAPIHMKRTKDGNVRLMISSQKYGEADMTLEFNRDECRTMAKVLVAAL